MLFLQEDKEFQDQAILLSMDEILNPMEVVRSIFNEIKLGEVRDVISKAIEVCLTTTNQPFSKAAGRYELLSTFKKIELLIEATSLLY